jgi:two-component system, NtrC family, nitrogen regulation sensor histidine kinase GlnL
MICPIFAVAARLVRPLLCGTVSPNADACPASVNLWHEIVDSLGDAVIAVSSSIKTLAVNPAAETLLGVSKAGESVIAELMRGNEWLRRMVTECLETGQNLADPENVLKLTRRSVSVRAEVSPLLDEDGKPAGAIILLQDLSHQKSAEQAFEADWPGVKLSPAGLAHEIKNPLTGIKGAAELLVAMFPNETRARDYCSVILDGVNRVAALVEQVLAVSSPQRLSIQPVNIHRVLHQSLRMAGLYPQAPEGISVQQVFDPSLPEVEGDAAALERVFLNLIRNAIDAIESHGTIRLTTRMETEFRMTAHGRRRQFLRVEIADSGRGMTDGELAQLFTPFFTTKAHGTGLGLVISQRVVAMHGGRLWGERGGVAAPTRSSSAGEATAEELARASGMTFRVTLPVRTGSPTD